MPDIYDYPPKHEGQKVEVVVEGRTVYEAKKDVDGVLDWYSRETQFVTKEINERD